VAIQEPTTYCMFVVTFKPTPTQAEPSAKAPGLYGMYGSKKGVLSRGCRMFTKRKLRGQGVRPVTSFHLESNAYEPWLLG
jgi:hypothetical protein